MAMCHPATGWMSNRGRQNVASYLALDLEEDWRQGADWFESCLLDYDVCSNWGNWVAAAGVQSRLVPDTSNETRKSRIDRHYVCPRLALQSWS